MKDVILAIFGAYEPVTTTVIDAAGETVTAVASGLAGVDWPYIAGVLLFGVVLYCFFRLVGVLLSK